MINKKTYSLCEAVADIAYIAAEEKYVTEDSREKISQFIEWAVHFEYIHRNIEWGNDLDYIHSIYQFTIFKISQWRNG